MMNHNQTKIDPKAIGFDIDGVVADTMTLFLAIAEKEFNIRHISYNDISCYELAECLNMDPMMIHDIIVRLLTGAYDDPLKPFEGAGEVLTRLAADHGPVRFVTARPSAEVIHTWIADTFSLLPSGFELVATGSFEAKAEELNRRGIQWFVDDRLETCWHLADNGINPILFKQPWNRNNKTFPEVESWRQIAAMIDF